MLNKDKPKEKSDHFLVIIDVQLEAVESETEKYSICLRHDKFGKFREAFLGHGKLDRGC